jgi:hypothetical protein
LRVLGERAARLEPPIVSMSRRGHHHVLPVTFAVRQYLLKVTVNHHVPHLTPVDEAEVFLALFGTSHQRHSEFLQRADLSLAFSQFGDLVVRDVLFPCRTSSNSSHQQSMSMLEHFSGSFFTNANREFGPEFFRRVRRSSSADVLAKDIERCASHWLPLVVWKDPSISMMPEDLVERTLRFHANSAMDDTIKRGGGPAKTFRDELQTDWANSEDLVAFIFSSFASLAEYEKWRIFLEYDVQARLDAEIATSQSDDPRQHRDERQ